MRVFRFLMLLLLLLASSSLRAQTASELLNWTRTHLDRGNCDEARETYTLYKEKVPQGNAEVERRIDECGNASQPNMPKQDLTFTVNGVNFKMVFVEGGSFTMGCTSTSEKVGDCLEAEKPVHQVSVSDYYIGETEVTQALWLAVMGTTIKEQRDKANSSFPIRGEGLSYPMYYVTYTEVVEFCNLLNRLLESQLSSIWNFTLPSEAQWEYAARGGKNHSDYIYAGSDNISDVAWYWDRENDNESNYPTHHPVKRKKANALGLYDMTGNVDEWCLDWFAPDYYSISPYSNPVNDFENSYRVTRGGSSGTNNRGCRVYYRTGWRPSTRSTGLGFRLALVRR